VLCLGFSSAQGEYTPGMVRQKGITYKDGEILVKFKETRAVREATQPLHGFMAESYAAGLAPKAKTALKRVRHEVVKAYPRLGLMHVKVKPGISVEEAIRELKLSGEIEYAEPNYILHTQVLSNDPYLQQQWGLHNTARSGGVVDADIDAPAAWNIRTDGSVGADFSETIVAVIDSGVDYRHPDLVSNMWVNADEIAGDGIDNDYNGYVDDIYGWNAVRNNGDPMDDHSHGTHCAGIIGASGNNGKGAVGVNWKAKIMALKFLSASGSGAASDAIECINYLLNFKKANPTARIIINNSWGGGVYSTPLYNAINATQKENMLFMVAAGNDNFNTDVTKQYPSCYTLSNIISVGASTSSDVKASFSNYGRTTVDFFAPGNSILSTIPGNRYAYMSGTSMACPMASGAAALVWSQKPHLLASQVKSLLLQTRDAKAGFSGKCVSGGRLNVNKAISAP